MKSLHIILHKMVDTLASKDRTYLYLTRIKELIRRYTEGKKIILEIGCPRGETYFQFPDQTYIGLDLEYLFLKQFKESLTNFCLPLIQADATQLPLAMKSIDALYVLQTLELMEKRLVEISLRECRRVGKVDSIYFFQFLNRWSLQHTITGRRHWRGDLKYSYKALTYLKSRKLLKESGFDVIDEFH